MHNHHKAAKVSHRHYHEPMAYVSLTTWTRAFKRAIKSLQRSSNFWQASVSVHSRLNSTWRRQLMKTISALLALCVCGDFTGHWWITRSKGGDAELWCFLWMFYLICVRINGVVNNREAGDLRRHCAHYDVTEMKLSYTQYRFCSLRTVANNE